jgi:hypothetical protein
LPLAIQFGSAFLTAIRCHLASQTGWSAGISRGLRREQARLAVSAQIAAHAQRSIPRVSASHSFAAKRPRCGSLRCNGNRSSGNQAICRNSA